jgi:hypothetical protein
MKLLVCSLHTPDDRVALTYPEQTRANRLTKQGCQTNRRVTKNKEKVNNTPQTSPTVLI